MNYAQLNNLQNSPLKDDYQAKTSSQPKQKFVIYACKINIRSNTLQNYQKTIKYTKKNQWIKAIKENFHLY